MMMLLAEAASPPLEGAPQGGYNNRIFVH